MQQGGPRARRVEGGEADAVEAGEAVERPEPEVAVPRLEDRPHHVTGEPVLLLPDEAVGVLADRLGRFERGRGPAAPAARRTHWAVPAAWPRRATEGRRRSRGRARARMLTRTRPPTPGYSWAHAVVGGRKAPRVSGPHLRKVIEGDPTISRCAAS